MDGTLTTWWSTTIAYFAAPLSLLTGHIQLATLVPTVGMLLGIIGIALAIRFREKQAAWQIVPAILTFIAPFVVSLGETMMGRFGTFFTLIAGLVCSLIWTGILANEATRRLPVWLIGLALFSFIAYFTLIAVAITWG